MSRYKHLLACASVSALLIGRAAVAQDVGLAVPAPEPSWLSALQVGGRIDAGATINPAAPRTGINFGRLFTDKANQLVLDQFDLSLERPLDQTLDHLQFGFAVEGLYGMDAQFTHFMGIGDQGSTGRNSFDLVRGDVELRAPVAAGVAVDVTAGLFLSPIGYERLDPTQNFFYSHSYIFNFGIPFKQTGLLTRTEVDSGLDLYLGYDTGINASAGRGGGYNDGRPHLVAGLATGLWGARLEAFTHIGPEDTPIAVASGVDAHRALRYDNDLSLGWALAPGLRTATEINYVRDDGLNAQAGGVAQYLTVDLSPALSAGLRAEVWRDAQGAFVAGYPGNLDYLDAEEGLPNGAFRAGPATYGELTLGLNIRPSMVVGPAGAPIDAPFRQITLRPEIRYDRVLAGASGFGASPGLARGQITFGLDVVVPLSFQRQRQASGASGPGTNGALPAVPSPSVTNTDTRASIGPPALAAAEPIATGDAIATLPGVADGTAGVHADTASRGVAQGGDPTSTSVGEATLSLTNPQIPQDLNGYLPGVTFAQSLDADVAPYVRGLGDSAPHTGQAPAVGLSLDGVAIDGAFARLLDPGALASVRAAYGPSGLLQGRDASAGVIDFLDRKPTRQWGVDAQYSLEQGFHASNERVGLNAPLGPNAGMSLSVSHHQRGGYLNNVYSGDGLYGRAETTTANLQFDGSLTPALEVNLNVTLAHGDGQGNPLALGDGLDAGQLGAALTANNPGLKFNAYGSPYLPGVTQGLGVFQAAAAGGNAESLTAQLYSLSLADDSAVGRFTSVTAFLREDQNGGQALGGSCAGAVNCDVLANPLVGGLQSSFSRRYRQFSQELRFDHDFGAFAKVRLGAYFLDDLTDQSLARQDLASPDPGAAAGSSTSTQTETETALFTSLDLHPSDQLTLSGSLRWVDDAESYGLAAGPRGGTGGRAVAGSTGASRLLSRIEMDYHLSRALWLYADRATGLRPGGLSLGATLSERAAGQANSSAADPRANDATFGPQTDTSYEVGARIWTLDGRLTGRITGYLNNISGLQTPETVLSPGVAEAFNSYIINIPRAQTRGVEGELTYHPTLVPGLTLTGLGGYENARITNGLAPAAQIPVTSLASPGMAGSAFNLAGTPLVRAPAFNVTGRADYGRQVGPGRFDIDIAYGWTSRYALAVSGGLGDYQPAMGLLDLSVGYQRSFYKIAVTARNLLNHIYFANAAPAFFTHSWGDPRTVVLSLDASF